MDSRIREIEQRLARAKVGLSEGGREDYLNQLYLLDAEIKAVIKDNEILPHAYSPPRRQRSLAAPVLQFGMSFGAVILAATITYAAFQVASVNSNTNQQAIGAAVATAPTFEAVVPILPQSAEESPGAPEPQAGFATTDDLLAGTILARNEESPDSPVETPEVEPNPAPGKPIVVTESGDLQVVAENTVPPMEDTPMFKAYSAAKPASGGTATGVDPSQAASDKEGFNWTIARFALPGEAKKTDTEEIEVVNSLKEKLNESADSSE